MAKTAKSHSAETTQVELPPLLPADRHNSRLTLIIKEYLQPDEIALVWKAYRLSKKAHEGQKRSSGEDYITHPVSVACIAARCIDSSSFIARRC